MIFLLFFYIYSYILIWNIVDARWELQLYRPLHAAAYYLNPHYHYNPNFKVNANIKIGLYQCLERMVPNASERCKIDFQLESSKDVKWLFGIKAAKTARDNKKKNSSSMVGFLWGWMSRIKKVCNPSSKLDLYFIWMWA